MLFDGLPSQKQDHFLYDALLPKAQNFSFAEERRLFYVAITRSKKRTFLIADMSKPSSFVLELLMMNTQLNLMNLRFYLLN